MENPIQMDDWGYPYDLGNLHIVMPWFWITSKLMVVWTGCLVVDTGLRIGKCFLAANDNISVRAIRYPIPFGVAMLWQS